MSRLRILLLGPECNPEQVSIPLVTYSHAAALAKLHDVTLVGRAVNEEALRGAKGPFAQLRRFGRRGSTASSRGVSAGFSKATMIVRR